MLDPLNAQSHLSDALQDRFESMLEEDASNESHDDPDFRPAFAPREPFRRDGPKIGPNDPCPCGSGKKFKKCCRE